MLLECANCGAPFDVEGQPQIVKCTFCGASAEIGRLRTSSQKARENWQPPAHWAPQPRSTPPVAQKGNASLLIGIVVFTALVGLGAFVGYLESAPALPSDGTCPSSFSGISSSVGCRCAAGSSAGSVWGSDLYTADSSVCAAARHAGAVGPSGGMVEIRPASGCASYPGTTRNGVQSSSWGRYDASFYFVGHGNGTCGGSAPVVVASQACPSNFQSAAATELRCECPSGTPSGSVWGSGIYTTDSAVCAAARHAGAIAANGGPIVAIAAPGCSSYKGSTRNEVTTGAWGQYGGSFYFRGHGTGQCTR